MKDFGIQYRVMSNKEGTDELMQMIDKYKDNYDFIHIVTNTTASSAYTSTYGIKYRALLTAKVFIHESLVMFDIVTRGQRLTNNMLLIIDGIQMENINLEQLFYIGGALVKNNFHINIRNDLL